MKRYCLIVLFLFQGMWYVNAQDNEARLVLLYGGNIPFNFNSITKYQNGIEITNGTLFGIHMVDLIGTMTGWHIDFQSFNNQPTIDGDMGNTLPLNAIQVEATDANGNLATAVFEGFKDLQVGPGDRLMFTIDPAHIPADPSTHQINLTYQCGMANGSLLGEAPDYYTVEIEVILIPDF